MSGERNRAPHRPLSPEFGAAYQEWWATGDPNAGFASWLAARDAQVAAEAEARGAREALLSAADMIESADVYDELSRPDARGVYWREDCVVDAVEHSGPIADWLRARAGQAGADR